MHYTADKIAKMFGRRIREMGRDWSKLDLLGDESAGKIPLRRAIKTGASNVKAWQSQDLPAIAKQYGFLDPAKDQKVICFYTGKGGVLKTTIAYNFARILAIHGINTLIIGLDLQESITTLAIGEYNNPPYDDDAETYGLYHFLLHAAPMVSCTQRTDLDALSIIPENAHLNLLEKGLRDELKRWDIFKKRLLPHLKKYDVIIFDCSPSWNLLIENGLTASQYVIAPLSCETGTHQALNANTKILQDFKNTLDLKWQDYITIPTLAGHSNISDQIMESYHHSFKNTVTKASIKRAISGQECSAVNKSIIEYAPVSPLADDYYHLIKELWDRINQ